MKQFELPFFGLVDVENVTESQEYMEIDFQDRELALMWFAEEDIDENYFQNAKNILEDLEKFDKESKAFLEKELHNEQDTTVLEYLSFHLEEEHLAEFFAKIIDKNASEEENLKSLLKAMYLKTISFHKGVIIADYVVNHEISDQILAISLYSNGKKNIAWES